MGRFRISLRVFGVGPWKEPFGSDGPRIDCDGVSEKGSSRAIHREMTKKRNDALSIGDERVICRLANATPVGHRAPLKGRQHAAFTSITRHPAQVQIARPRNPDCEDLLPGRGKREEVFPQRKGYVPRRSREPRLDGTGRPIAKDQGRL